MEKAPTVTKMHICWKSKMLMQKVRPFLRLLLTMGQKHYVVKTGGIKYYTNLWRQRTPHRSCRLILVRYSADTSEWRCAFVMSLWVRKK